MSSNQAGPHPRLPRLLERYRARPSQRPVDAASAAVLATLDRAIADHAGPLVLDSGCGTGESSVALATLHPRALVIAVDRSAARLARGHARVATDDRVISARLRLEDVWRHAARARWPLTAHYLLYPNPWPKQHHLARRWHAHPAFADLVDLGGHLEMRTNWQVYAAEFAFALRWWCGCETDVATVAPSAPLSPFERKYAASGHTLYRVVATLADAGAAGPA